METAYQQFVAASDLSEHSKRAYLSRFDNFLKFLESKEENDKIHVRFLLEQYKSHLSEDLSLKGSSVNRYISTARHYISFMGLTPPAVSRVEESRTAFHRLRQDEVARLLYELAGGGVNRRDRILIKLMLFLALRPAECCQLQWSDLMRTTDHLWIEVGVPGKRRTLAVPSVMEDDLKVYLNERRVTGGSCQKLFVSREDSPLTPNALDRIVRTVSHRARMNASCLALRNTCLAGWLESTDDAFLVAKLSGASLDTLMRYQRLLQAQPRSLKTG